MQSDQVKTSTQSYSNPCFIAHVAGKKSYQKRNIKTKVKWERNSKATKGNPKRQGNDIKRLGHSEEQLTGFSASILPLCKSCASFNTDNER